MLLENCVTEFKVSMYFDYSIISSFFSILGRTAIELSYKNYNIIMAEVTEIKTFYVKSNEKINKIVNVDDITINAIRLSELQGLTYFKIAIIGDTYAVRINKQFLKIIKNNKYCNFQLKCFGRGGLKIKNLLLDPKI